ncbi:MAG: hypothetical protein FJ267_01765, partial [Planctomycetes bacterium]|nr:hypothetical protein [Planctomycetota bacterium]
MRSDFGSTRLIPSFVLALITTFCFSSSCCNSLFADDGDDENLRPGLLARYSSGDRTVDRVDSDISFEWFHQLPDERMRKEPFQAVWNGTILLREEGTTTFHAFVQGQIELRIG